MWVMADDPQEAKAQTHLPKELESRKYYRSIGSSSVNDEEDLKASWVFKRFGSRVEGQYRIQLRQSCVRASGWHLVG